MIIQSKFLLFFSSSLLTSPEFRLRDAKWVLKLLECFREKWLEYKLNFTYSCLLDLAQKRRQEYLKERCFQVFEECFKECALKNYRVCRVFLRTLFFSNFFSSDERFEFINFFPGNSSLVCERMWDDTNKTSVFSFLSGWNNSYQEGWRRRHTQLIITKHENDCRSKGRQVQQ